MTRRLLLACALVLALALGPGHPASGRSSVATAPHPAAVPASTVPTSAGEPERASTDPDNGNGSTATIVLVGFLLVVLAGGTVLAVKQRQGRLGRGRTAAEGAAPLHR